MFEYDQNIQNQKNESQIIANWPDVSTTCTSGVLKLDDSQWKDYSNHPNLVGVCMAM